MWMFVRRCGLILLFALFVRPSTAQESGLVIEGAWARPTAVQPDTEMTPEAKPEAGHGMAMGTDAVSAAYMTITNTGEQMARLVSARSAAAGVVEIHETKMENNVMRMSPLTVLEIPPGETVELRPGGYHIMLLDLVHDLYAGEALALALTFEVEGQDAPYEAAVGVPVLDSAPVSGSIRVSGAWARATALRPEGDMQPPDATPEAKPEAGHGMAMGTDAVSAAYMTITNIGEQTARLLSVTSAGAATVEIHETKMENNVMRMSPLTALEIPAGEAVELRPGGYHIMLMGLARDLYPGDAIALALLFENGESVIVGVPVQE